MPTWGGSSHNMKVPVLTHGSPIGKRTQLLFIEDEVPKGTAPPSKGHEAASKKRRTT